MDWERLAGPSPWYGIAAANTRTVGARSGQFLKFLINEFGLNIDDIHVIGFSLGGQLVAFIGQELNGTLPRITGLDPAGFLFHTNPADEKLSPDDARFVDVIHSAGLWIGTDEQVGHVDFYPNGGTAPQPGCEGNDDLGLGCSHARAPVSIFSNRKTLERSKMRLFCDDVLNSVDLNKKLFFRISWKKASILKLASVQYNAVQ